MALNKIDFHIPCIRTNGRQYIKEMYKPSLEKNNNVVFDFLYRFYPNWAVQPQTIDRNLKFRILEQEGLYFPSNENKGADQPFGP